MYFYYNGLFQINCTLPHRGCQCYECKKVWNSTCYFAKFSWKSRVRKQESVDFERLCEFLVEFCVKIRISVQKTWKSSTIFYQKSLEIQPPLWG